MKQGNKVVLGIFGSRKQAEHAVDTLKNSGFRSKDISVLMPEFAPFVAAGPIMSALAGVGMGGAVGGLSGALVGLGFPEYEAKRYEEFIHDGGILLSVHVDDSAWLEKATEILKATGAKDISSTSEEEGYRAHVPESELYRHNQSQIDPNIIMPFPF